MSKRKSFKKVYDRLADSYDLAYGRVLSRGHKLAVQNLKLKSTMNVLEVGVGTGLTFEHLPKTIRVTGIDISQAMLDVALERIERLQMPHATVIKMSAEDMSFSSNKFDRVIAPSVISAVRHPEKMISEMIRVCKPGGYICVISHFAGQNVIDKLADRLFNPITQKILGYRMTTSPAVIENAEGVKVLKKQPVMPFWKNFSTLYILRKN
ncbi:MAG: methyltransferase domain-containing protein [Oligoflexia bacterium]|nr:methyltransferase domain-containing protein [Oligoflexia bacterium]